VALARGAVINKKGATGGKGYGTTRAWNGKRIPPKNRLIDLIIGIGVLILPVILIANGKD
jgi:hypothetical protein